MQGFRCCRVRHLMKPPPSPTHDCNAMAKKHKRKNSRSKPHKRKPSAVAVVHEAYRIVTSRIDESGTELFRLRWKGCEAADDSWKTKEQLDGEECKELLEEFLATGEEGHKRVGFKETVTLKRVNAAGNSMLEEVVLKG